MDFNILETKQTQVQNKSHDTRRDKFESVQKSWLQY